MSDSPPDPSDPRNPKDPPPVRHLRRLHGRSAPPGRERKILRQLPFYLLAGTLIPAFASILVRLMPLSGPPAAVARKISRVDIFSIATVITVWTAIFTVAVGCIVVVIMKGPGYVADAYPVDDEPDVDKDNDEKPL